MSYFQSNLQCAHYPEQWSHVLQQVHGWRSPYSIAKDISQSLEAKALYVFSIARRLTRAAYGLYLQTNGWKPIFLEATVLLFPMIELVGYSRVDDNEVERVFGNRDVSGVNLWAGLHWLRDTEWLPTVQDTHQRADPTLFSKWQIGHLLSLRHYLLHGSKQVSYRGSQVPIDDIIHFELADYIVAQVHKALPKFWQQLRQDDGNQRWIERLAQADIRPLKIQGSKLYEDGLIDPDIVDCLEGNASLLS